MELVPIWISMVQNLLMWKQLQPGAPFGDYNGIFILRGRLRCNEKFPHNILENIFQVLVPHPPNMNTP